MPQSNLIDVVVYPADQSAAIEGHAAELEFYDVNYISFVSSPGGSGEGTYGIPAILSDARVKGEGLPVKVLYVNPANIAAIEAVRRA